MQKKGIIYYTILEEVYPVFSCAKSGKMHSANILTNPYDKPRTAFAKETLSIYQGLQQRAFEVFRYKKENKNKIVSNTAYICTSILPPHV